MKEEYLLYPANYFTATIYEWKPALANDGYKDIIIESLQFMVDKKRIVLNAFVVVEVLWSLAAKILNYVNQFCGIKGFF